MFLTDQCSETLFQKQFEPKLHTFSIKQLRWYEDELWRFENGSGSSL